jgi:hypothetical protein
MQPWLARWPIDQGAQVPWMPIWLVVGIFILMNLGPNWPFFFDWTPLSSV